MWYNAAHWISTRKESQVSVTVDGYEVFIIDEVLNYGGFFGGTTVTLYAHPPDAPREDRKFIIADHVFENLKGGDRFKILEGQVLGLVLDGEEVRTARIIGAGTREQLREVATPLPTSAPSPGPRSLAYQCNHCGRWYLGTPPRHTADGPYVCAVCGQELHAGGAGAGGSGR
jgi:hypothetical protein